MSKDARQVAKQIQQDFVKTAQLGMGRISDQLQEILINTIINCPDRKCFMNKMENIRQLNKESNGLLQYLGDSLQECISREFSHQGLEGYNKCFLMFAKVIDWETKNKFSDDPSIKIGMQESIQSKQYHKKKSQQGKFQ